jgi:endonuclease/exonuclease/phosphatase family protein
MTVDWGAEALLSQSLKLATWNIGGGILGESHQRHCEPSPDYYVSVLRKHQPDVVCLQEVHSFAERREGQAAYLARSAGYPHFTYFRTSESHLVPGAWLGLGILSRYPLQDFTYREFPNPRLETVGPRGEPWQLHDKGYATGFVDLGGRTLGLVNGHCFPLHHFGASPAEPRFAKMWAMLTEDLLAAARSGLAFAGIDMNHERVEELLVNALGPGRYSNAFGGTPTTPRGNQWDYLLYGPAMRLLTVTVAPTESDHYYCQVGVLA